MGEPLTGHKSAKAMPVIGDVYKMKILEVRLEALAQTKVSLPPSLRCGALAFHLIDSRRMIS